MARKVMCTRLKKEVEGLEKPPFPGELGREIFEHVSLEAWEAWKEMQIKIVNEYRLDLSEEEHRKTLAEQMRTFLGLDGESETGELLSVGTPKD